MTLAGPCHLECRSSRVEPLSDSSTRRAAWHRDETNRRWKSRMSVRCFERPRRAATGETRNLIDEKPSGSAQARIVLYQHVAGRRTRSRRPSKRAVRERGVRAGLDVFAGEPAAGTGNGRRLDLSTGRSVSALITSALRQTRRSKR